MASPKLNKAYKQAKAKGNEAEFLAAHPKFANRGPSTGGGKSKAPWGKIGNKQTQKALKGEEKVAQYKAGQQVQWYNPSYNTPFGGQKVTFDENGMPVYNQYLSQPNQQILDQGQGLTIAGQQKAADAIQGFSPFQTGDYAADRQKAADAVYAEITKHYDRDFAREEENLRQRFHNTGRPWDENNPEVQAMRERQQAAKDSAANQAFVQGGSEFDRAYGAARGTHQQQFADIQGLQGMGTGFIAPQLPGYQAPSYDLSNPTAVGLQYAQLAQQQQQIDQAGAAAAANAQAALITANNSGQQSSGPDPNNPFPLPGEPGYTG